MNIKIVHPDSKKEINLNEKNEYNFFENIPDLFLGDDSSITSTQSDFYNDVKFPNYDNFNDFASLLETGDDKYYIDVCEECVERYQINYIYVCVDDIFEHEEHVICDEYPPPSIN